ncbi:DUF305 domain-containing protein [Thermopolyspora sp. NPDC052614]|uniref:DUF305 domain-containing protein n=1 Tax=Thermopolyspora sp. NPDC052614 TaxID=3155682 RepID=UPI00341BBCA0
MIAVLSVAGACSGDPSEGERPRVAGGDAPVIVPGGPGDAGRTATPGERLGTAQARLTAADVLFAEAMVPHHRQALEMAALAPERAADKEVKALAARISAGQGPEIKVMSSWLRALGREAPTGHGGHAAASPQAYGMATADQLNRLRAARGPEFDDLFLRLMITHHEGAVRMSAEELRSGADRVMLKMAQDIQNGQRIEISRMRALRAKIAD